MKSFKKQFVLVLAAAVAIAAVGAGCHEKTAEEKMKDAAGDAKDAMKDAADKTGDAIKEGAKATKDAVTNAVGSMTSTNK